MRDRVEEYEDFLCETSAKTRLDATTMDASEEPEKAGSEKSERCERSKSGKSERRKREADKEGIRRCESKKEGLRKTDSDKEQDKKAESDMEHSSKSKSSKSVGHKKDRASVNIDKDADKDTEKSDPENKTKNANANVHQSIHESTSHRDPILNFAKIYLIGDQILNFDQMQQSNSCLNLYSEVSPTRRRILTP